MTPIRFVCSVCLLSLLLAGCMPPNAGDQRSKDKIKIDLRDKSVQKIFNFKDQRLSDSLALYLKNPDATLRYLAALSFASWKDSTHLEALAGLLADPIEEVRIAAAFSLGQSGSARAVTPLINAFESGDSLSEHQRFNATVLEAVGKCGKAANLRHIATISTYQATDTLLLEGQCRAIYRFGLRGITDSLGTRQMVRCVANERLPDPARLMAAHYLARAKEVAPDSSQAAQIAAAYVRSKNPEIRMAIATALGKSRTGPAFGMLSKVIQTEKDWRVKCNIIKALGKFDYDTVRTLVSPFATDTNLHIALTAADFFVNNGQAKDGDYYWRIANDRANQNMPVPVQIALFRASNKWLPGHDSESKNYINYRLREMFLQSKNPYERADCLRALGEYGWQYRWIHEKGFADTHPAVKSAAAEALLSIAKRPDFFRFFGESGRGVRREMYNYLREIVASGDAGMIAAAAEGFSIPALDFRSLRDTTRERDLDAALKKLQIPRDLEAYMALQKAIAWLAEKPEPAPFLPSYNHPIDWGMLNNTTFTKVEIQTSKGTITAEFFPFSAPGSVANFIDLAKNGFFNGKAVHRVVPNFVIQSGCPRGDGYGALAYSIRTEIGLEHFDGAGYLGMASAGKDTEGTQWFITQSPTPHLDGQYTIFGRVTQGQDVVNKIQVGDKIEKVEIR